MTIEFEDDPLAKWRREGDEITAREDAAREQRRRTERRAQREATRVAYSVDETRLEEALQFERDITNETCGTLIGEMINDLRSELEKKMEVSLRISLLEQNGMLPKICGVWDGDRTYDALSICSKDGGTFIAKRSGAGPCPGEDWQLLACRGSRGQPGPIGPRGETGPPGARGEPGPEFARWDVDLKRLTVTPIFSDNRFGPPLNLRGLFEAFIDQRSGIDVDDAKAAKAAARAAERQHIFNQPPLVALVHGPPPTPAEEETAG